MPSIVSRQSLIISKNSFILGQLFLKKTAHKYFSSVPRTMWFIRLLYIISPLFFWREVVLFACFTKRNSKRISEILQWMIDADVRELCRRVTELKFFFWSNIKWPSLAKTAARWPLWKIKKKIRKPFKLNKNCAQQIFINETLKDLKNFKIEN